MSDPLAIARGTDRAESVVTGDCACTAASAGISTASGSERVECKRERADARGRDLRRATANSAGISTASGSERVAWRSDSRRVATAISVLFLVASSLPLSGCLEDRSLGAWTPLSTRQFAVPLAPGTTTVEVRDIRDGWVERVSVESDGRTVTAGINLEPLQPARPRVLSSDDQTYLRGDAADPIPTSGAALDRATSLCTWVGRSVDRLRNRSTNAIPDDEFFFDPKVVPKETQLSDPHYYPPVVPPRPHEGDPPIDSDDACEVLRSIADGARSNCRSYATVYADATSLAGLTARRVDMAVRYGSPYEGHSLVEVWSPELERWFVADPFFQALWTLDGDPASVFELHRAAVEGRSMSIGFKSTGTNGASLEGARVNPRLYPRNIFIRTASGAWLSHTGRAPAPVTDTNILQCDDGAVFAAPPGAVDACAVRRDSLHGRIAFQAIDGRLVVCLNRERFESGRFEARAAANRTYEFFDELVAHDPADPEIAAGPELLPETRLVDDDGDGSPDRWTIEHAPTLFEAGADGSAIIESGVDGARLSVKPTAPQLASIVGFAQVSVERGAATLSFGGKVQSSPFTVSAGRTTVASTAITGGGRGDSGLQLELGPNSRVTVAWVSMRNVPRFGGSAGVTSQ